MERAFAVRTAAVTGAAALVYMLAPTWQLLFLGPPDTEAVFVSYASWISGMSSYALMLPAVAAVLTFAGTLLAALRWKAGGRSIPGATCLGVAAVVTLIAALVFNQVTPMPILLLAVAWLAVMQPAPRMNATPTQRGAR